ncbi:hypothetical protein CRM22_006378 [Opisthorchis felineus]|uniref:UBX domain-containing protein n=1 Tax=Opisthorchis felineus TaxID=147828 RepID=A0A4S2LSM3_OPIFE|nr:hypothetical protein CRM22_006378 [Opisthorchis felineus]
MLVGTGITRRALHPLRPELSARPGMASDLDQLLEMGFERSLAEKALKNTGNNGLSAAMDWIVEHQGDNEITESGGAAAEECKEAESPAARVFKCEECSKMLRNDEEVQLHSVRTGHVNYSESAESLKPLTEEERKLQMEKLQELLQQKKLQREAKEREEELEREKQRRRQGKDIVSAKAKFEEDEMKRLVEQRRREKEEDRAYRERLKADIAREREEKKMRERGEAAAVAPSSKPTLPPQTTKSDATICRLHIRLPTGQPLKYDFGANEPLSAVRLYVCQHWPDGSDELDPTTVNLFTTFPKRDYAEDDMQTTLSDLGLCPSAVLMARRKLC